MFNGQQFIHIPEDNSFVCITSDDNLKFMTTKYSDLFADGTFNYAPKYFMQNNFLFKLLYCYVCIIIY